MRLVILILMFLLFTSCKEERKKAVDNKVQQNEIIEDTIEFEKETSEYLDSIPGYLEGLYGYRGLYSKISMVDCPDFIEFTKEGQYYGYNDCGMGGPNDTIAESGNYQINIKKKELVLYDRKFERNTFFENNSEDTLNLNLFAIKGDSIIINKEGVKVYYLRKSRKISTR